MAFSNPLSISLDPRRIYGLDILRAFAILSVMFGHSSVFVSNSLLKYNELLAFDGVSLFFVLSGFLIGGILIKTLDKKKADVSVLFDFWMKRWFRTIPPYFLTLIIVILLSLKNPNFKFNYYKEYFVFLQNFKSPHPIFFQEAWSLCVEEWFYLLIPSSAFLLIRVGGNSKIAVLVISIFVLLSITVYRYYKYTHFPIFNAHDWDQNFRKIVVTRLDSLMYGVIAAYFSYHYANKWQAYSKMQFTFGVAMLCIGKMPPSIDSYGLYSCVFSFSLNSLGAMFLLPYLYGVKIGNGLIYRTLTYISLISYSLYLLNNTIVSAKVIIPLLQILKISINYYNILGYLLFWLLSVTIYILMYKYFEVPLIKLRNILIDK